jgi:hypothetical protein
VIASGIEWDLLGEAVLNSFVIGLGVLLVGGIAVVASLRAQDAREGGREGAFVGLSAMSLVCILGIAGAVVAGIWVMTQ